MLVILVGAIAAFLYYPRAGSASTTDAATLAVLNTAIEGSRGGGAFAVALDGEIFKTGDLVRANTEGRAVLTFFDGSTLSVDPGSQVKVLALNRLPGDGIQVTLEQTLGRSWSAVQKLKTSDSRWEIRTPTTTAAVRGTAFQTLVQPAASGGTQTTYQVDEGTLQITATAGGTVAVGAGQQATIAEGQPAPAAATALQGSSRLDISVSQGLRFLAIAPSGAACGTFGNKAEIFGCVLTQNRIQVRDPSPGRWSFFATAAEKGNHSLTIETRTATSMTAQRFFSRSFNVGDQVRTALTVTAGASPSLSQLDEVAPVTSLCAAAAPGRVFASGDAGARFDAVRSFANQNKGAPVSVVYTEAELNQAITQGTSSGQGVSVSDAKVTIDQAGIHATGRAKTQLLTLNASVDVVGGPVGDKFSLRIARISADPLPPGLVDMLRSFADTSASAAAEATPFLVKQVAFRSGCFFVAGVTPS